MEIRESRWHVTCSIVNALMLDCPCPRNGSGLFDASMMAERCYSLDDKALTADASHRSGIEQDELNASGIRTCRAGADMTLCSQAVFSVFHWVPGVPLLMESE